MSEQNKTESKLSRRQFIGGSAAAFAIPTIIPEGVIARKGRAGANDRIVIANIGCGGMGSSHIVAKDRDEVKASAALCDVDETHLANAAKKVQDGTPALYKDYRAVLDRKDIDAVTIGTPDHWHAIMAVHACQAGKDVYSEKPVCKTIEEAHAMLNAARYHKRIVQIGMQGRSNTAAHAACQYVRNGQLGKVTKVDIWHPSNFTTKEYDTPQTPPSTLDWNMWLGPAKWSTYHPLKAHFNFRWWMDYGAGFIRDRGNHAISVVSWLMNHDDWKGVVTCEATGTPHLGGMYDAPTSMEVKWTFTNPEWTLTWSQPGKPNPVFPGEWGATYTGDQDSLVVIGGDGGCSTEQKAIEYSVPAGGKTVPLFKGKSGDATQRHRENWYNCIKTRELPAADIGIGANVITLPIIANISYVLGRKVQFDMNAVKFINDEAADRMISMSYRSPWKLG